MKWYKIMGTTVLMTMLITSSSTFVYAMEKEIIPQQIQTSDIIVPNVTDQTKNCDVVSMNNLDKAVQAALLGPEIKKIKIFDHEFNVKSAYISKKNSQTIVNGQISHNLSCRPDDQIYYRIVKENGEIKNLEIKIDRGGWKKITIPIMDVIAQYFDMPIKSNYLSQIGQQLGDLIDGKWEYASEAIITTIALYVK